MLISSKRLYTAGLLAAVGITCLSLTGCAEHDEPLNIAGNHWLGYQPLFIVDQRSEGVVSQPDQRFSGINLTVVDSSATVMRLFANGQINGALLTLDEAIRFQADTGLDLCVPMVLDYSNGADALVINPQALGDSSLPELIIGREQTYLGAYLFRRAQEVKGWGPLSLSERLIESSEHLSAYDTGRVNALITYEPHLTRLIERGAEIAFSSRDIPQEVIDLLVVERRYWQNNPGQVERLKTEIWPLGYQLLHQRPASIFQKLSRATGLDAGDLETALNGIHFVSPRENQQVLQASLPAAIQQMGSYLLEMGVIQQPSALSACDGS